MVAKPEDYRWSGYGEACGAGKGAKQARAGLASIQREGLENPEAEAVVDEMEASGRAMPLPEALRRTVRYFTDGAVIGSAGFVEEVFGRLKAEGRTGPRRKSGPRKMRGADFGGLRSLRDLRVRAMGREGENEETAE
jgi:hypothetical protein